MKHGAPHGHAGLSQLHQAKSHGHGAPHRPQMQNLAKKAHKGGKSHADMQSLWGGFAPAAAGPAAAGSSTKNVSPALKPAGTTTWKSWPGAVGLATWRAARRPVPQTFFALFLASLICLRLFSTASSIPARIFLYFGSYLLA